MSTNGLDSDKPGASTAPTDLNAFQRDALAAIADRGGTPSGAAIKTTLEHTFGYDDISSAQLYPSLDTLVNCGLVEKGRHDGRTNAYRLTDAGVQLLARHVERLQVALHGRGGVA